MSVDIKQPELTSTELVERVMSADKKRRNLNLVGLALASALIILVLTLLSIFTISNARQLHKLIDTNHNINVTQNKRELALIDSTSKQTAATQDLLKQQDEYILCLVSLFTHQTNVSVGQLAACKPPFSLTHTPTVSSPGGASSIAPKASTQSSLSSSDNAPSTSSPSTPSSPTPTPPPSQNPIQRAMNPLNRLLQSLGL